MRIAKLERCCAYRVHVHGESLTCKDSGTAYYIIARCPYGAISIAKQKAKNMGWKRVRVQEPEPVAFDPLIDRSLLEFLSETA